MTDREKIQAIATAVTAAAANISEAIMDPAIDAATGYRMKLEGAGFSPAIAEQMAAQYHVEFIKVLFSLVTTKGQK